MGMSYSSFLEFTPRQFFNAVHGFIEDQERKDKSQWQRTSFIAAYIASKPVQGYRIKVTTPERILPEAWGKTNSLPDEDEIAQLRKRTWPQER